ncbi:hypothetical protein F7731_08610 [Cytobacillus depressus]|uniref:Uncharacterized protein n=2 Tax=Cytobacillus depressus TaxID=1602942 RepID=A0A6L3V8G6_9BACI|nr:hypothetical protein F7731_08610 [Cytobacillus depressus]
MEIDYEKLSQAIKAFAEVCRPLVEQIKKAWSVLKSLAKDYIQHLPKYPKLIHPAVSVKQSDYNRLRSQVLINKPMRVRARTCC